MSIEIRPATDRSVTRTEGRETCHSFAFGAHYDPSNLGFGAITAFNDERLPPGTGYDDHPHRDIEIVTWVLDGALRHTDSDGHSLVLGPGELLRTSAGDGIVHSEVTESGVRTRFVQTWLRPDLPGGTPSLEHGVVGSAAELTEVVGPGAGLRVGTTGARLYVARSAGGTVQLPDVPRLHVFVADGAIGLGDRALGTGDAARLVDEGGRTLHVPEHATVAVWAFGG